MGTHIEVSYRVASAAGAGENMNASQFYFTLGPDLDSLDEKHTIFGEVHIQRLLRALSPALHTEVSCGGCPRLKSRMSFWGACVPEHVCAAQVVLTGIPVETCQRRRP